MTKIVIVGAGVMGLGCAVSIQEKCPGVDITLISERFSPFTTGDGAAGVWGPYLLGNTSPHIINEWARKSHDLFLEIWKSQDSGSMGVTLLPCCHVSDDENFPEPTWKNVVFGFRKMSTKELRILGKPELKCGYTFVTFTCEPSKLLPHLLKRFMNAGGHILEKRVTNLESLGNEFDIVINCTGIEAHKIVPDSNVFPIRGQVIRVEAPGQFYALLDNSEEDGGYVIPNQNSVILGGTHQEGNWDLSINPDDLSSIKSYCYRVVPSLKDAPTLRNWVGLRPGRTMVRLEIDTTRPKLLNKSNKPFTIIHNYGHAGSGVTLFWGCAQDVTRLVQQTILASASKL